MDTRDLYKLVRSLDEETDTGAIRERDSVTIQINEHLAIQTGVLGFAKNGIILEANEGAVDHLELHGVDMEPVDAEGTSRAIHEDDDSIEAVKNAITHRIVTRHVDLLSKYGIDEVMQAIDDVAEFAGSDGLDEIGSSDVSAWVNQVSRDLERQAGREQARADGWDPAVDERDQWEADELNEIKRLALGGSKECGCDEEMNEGVKTWAALGGLALIAASIGANKIEYANAIKNDPQLAKLNGFLQTAIQKGDQAKVAELKDRLKQTYDHYEVTGDEVRDETGNPVDPQYESKVYLRLDSGNMVMLEGARIVKGTRSLHESRSITHKCGSNWKPRFWQCKL